MNSKNRSEAIKPVNFRSAFILILLNVFGYLFFKHPNIDQEALTSFILYPGNLLKGNVLCLVTSGFFHSSVFHLGLNMVGIFIFARIVEEHFGPIKTLFIYFGSLLISMLLATLTYAFVFHKNVAIVGASGAVMGLISTAMLIAPYKITFEMILPLPVMIKAWLFFFADLKGFLGGEKDGVSHLTHLFGFLSIGFLVYFLDWKERKMMQRGLIINVITFFALVLLNQWIFYKTGKNFGSYLNLR